MAIEARDVLRDMNWDVSIQALRSYKQTVHASDPDLIVLGVPVQYWEIPDAAQRMIRALPQFENTAGFVFSTYGKCVCNTVPYDLAKELQSKGVSILGGAQIVMPNSSPIGENTRIGDLEASFGRGEVTENNLAQYRSILRQIATKVENGGLDGIDIARLKSLQTRNAIATLMDLVTTAEMRRGSMPQVQHDENRCTLCRACVKSCDYQAISWSDESEFSVDQDRCHVCYTCIARCPKNALFTDWEQVDSGARSIHRFSKNTETLFVT
jgi:NAD-dependent dihydropyrimidine dehydrogenase PreA subunit